VTETRGDRNDEKRKTVRTKKESVSQPQEENLTTTRGRGLHRKKKEKPSHGSVVIASGAKQSRLTQWDWVRGLIVCLGKPEIASALRASQ